MTVLVEVTPARVRSVALDGVRGLAVAMMVGDHLALFTGQDWFRETLGRVAMPLFFVLAGHLARRLSWRVAGIFAAGLVLPVLAPWVDAPNVLVHLAVGLVLLAAVRWASRPWLLPAFVVVVLTAAANFRLGAQIGNSYEPAALWALMCVGAMLDRQAFSWGRHVAFLAPLGRFPLTVYVGHVLLLTWLAS